MAIIDTLIGLGVVFLLLYIIYNKMREKHPGMQNDLSSLADSFGNKQIPQPNIGRAKLSEEIF